MRIDVLKKCFIGRAQSLLPANFEAEEKKNNEKFLTKERFFFVSFHISFAENTVNALNKEMIEGENVYT